MTYGVLVGVIDLAASDDSCGAKARRLGVLARAGFDVPAGFVVTADVSVNDPSVAAQVAQGLDRLTPRAVAVRSSASSEDGATASFAGQFESVLDLYKRTRKTYRRPNTRRLNASLRRPPRP